MISSDHQHFGYHGLFYIDSTTSDFYYKVIIDAHGDLEFYRGFGRPNAKGTKFESKNWEEKMKILKLGRIWLNKNF